MNCKKCKAPLTEKNIEKYSSTRKGFRSTCKYCKNEYKREKRSSSLVMVNCKTCEKSFKFNGKKDFCNIDCKIKHYSTQECNGCITWNSCFFPTPHISWGNKNRSLRKILALEAGVIIPLGQAVFMSCNNNKCINTNHFELRKTLDENISVHKRKIKKDIMNEITEKYEQYKWPISDIATHYSLSSVIVGNFIRRKYYKEINLDSDKETENYDICINCSKQHDNLGSQYCSTACMNEYLTKE